MGEEEQKRRLRERGLRGHRHSRCNRDQQSSHLRAVVVALAVAGCTAASAQTYENETCTSVRFYGQVSPVWQSFDDGDKTTSNLVDNAKARARWKPIYEVTQAKGDGEAHPFLSPNNEFADYETWDKANLAVTEPTTPDMLEFMYARSALKNGLALEQELGTNPSSSG